jgi:hypothetical protein
MQTRKLIARLTPSVAVALGLAAFSASADTYTDVLNDHQGSGNLLRDISSVTISNDASNFYIKLNMNPGANLATGGNFNYGIGITTGPGAGGDTSANAATHGNPYIRNISFDASLGGMTDFIGVFGAGGAGSVASPFTSYGFNTYAWNTNGVSLTWSKTYQINSGAPMSSQPATSIPNSIDLTVPMSSFAANLSLTPGTVLYFDVFSTGTSANQTAYDSLVVQAPIQSGTFSGTFQFNATSLFSYTIMAVPEPTALALLGLSGAVLLFNRRQRR